VAAPPMAELRKRSVSLALLDTLGGKIWGYIFNRLKQKKRNLEKKW
jgi:hypothetical protein